MDKEKLKMLDEGFKKILDSYKDKRNYKTVCANFANWWQNARFVISRSIKKGEE